MRCGHNEINNTNIELNCRTVEIAFAVGAVECQVNEYEFKFRLDSRYTFTLICLSLSLFFFSLFQSIRSLAVRDTLFHFNSAVPFQRNYLFDILFSFTVSACAVSKVTKFTETKPIWTMVHDDFMIHKLIQ